MNNKDNIVLRWNTAFLAAVRAANEKPPVVARSAALLFNAMYDAWCHYHPKALPVRNSKFRRLPDNLYKDQYRQAAMSYAAFRVLCELFPNQSAIFKGLMQEYGYDSSVLYRYDESTPALITDITPAHAGNTAAEFLMVYHREDGANQKNNYEDPAKDYKSKNEPKPAKVKDINYWQALSSKNQDGVWIPQKFLYPHWGWITPFCFNPSKELNDMVLPVRYPRPLPISPDEDWDLLSAEEKKAAKTFEENAHSLLKYSSELNDLNKSIAEYWADGPGSETPPGHWCLLAAKTSIRDCNDLNKDVKLFCALGLALFDGSIACWRKKVEVDYCRPISAIHTLLEGLEIKAWAGPYQGVKVYPAEQWKTYLSTPPFAEYVSGHSTFSSAAATILRLFTGSDYFGEEAIILAGSSKIEPGVTPGNDIVLKWPYFTDAAQEAGVSRIHGGIHYQNGNMEGQKLGKKIAKKAWDKLQKYYFNGITS